MHILLLTYEINGQGGNFIRCYALGRELAKLHHQVTIISGSKTIRVSPKITRMDNLTLIETNDLAPSMIRHDGLSPFDLVFRIYHIFTHQYDVVHGFGHRPTVAIPAFLHRFLYNKPYIADWSDLWGKGGIAYERTSVIGKLVGTFDQLTESLVYTHATALTAISQTLRQKAEVLKIPAHRILLLPVGCPSDRIKPIIQKYARAKLGVPQHTQLILFSGVAKYDQELLAHIFVELMILNPQVRFMFIGSNMPKFWNIVRTAHGEHHIRYEGFIPHEKMNLYLSSADICIFPYTNREINRARFPNKLGDYLAAGRPTVTNPTGDIKQLFLQYKIGLLASEDPKEFAKTIQKLLIRKKMRKEMGKTARLVSLSVLSWKKLATDLERFYLSVGTEYMKK